MGARNRVGLSYRPATPPLARLHRLAESIPGLFKSLKYCLCCIEIRRVRKEGGGSPLPLFPIIIKVSYLDGILYNVLYIRVSQF
jgi:hypothetical protein